MFELFKEETKNSLKEMEERQKKLEEINKSLKENQENAIKQIKATILDLNTKIETIKKTQTKKILEMIIMGK